MKSESIQSHVFWGNSAPLSTLVGLGFMIMATSRLAFAITLTGALVWVNVLTVLIASFGRPLLPKKGQELIWVFLAGFSGSLYLLLVYAVSPFLAMEITFLISLVPLFCAGSGICSRVLSLEPEDAILRAFLEALALGGILIALALIREPLGFGSLSFPGGPQGMAVLVFSEGLNFPVRIIAGASGGLLLLGYGLSLFRRFKARRSGGEDVQ
jgi:Na+-translocating ferredoxin:NAD+ oxidoreductase RnfE subunit